MQTCIHKNCIMVGEANNMFISGTRGQ